MSLTAAIVATALVLFAAPAAAEPPARAHRDASVTLGAGAMTTRGSLGDENVVNLSASGSWFPGGGVFGGRLQVGIARTAAGTSYVNSERFTGTFAGLATGRLHLGGPLSAVAGAGPGVLIVRSDHRVVADERAVWTGRPALTWTAGIELVHQQLILRVEHFGAWSDISRDLVYAVHVGMVF